MSIKRFDPGPRMSQAVVHNQTVYLAGQVGDVANDVQGQTRDALASVDGLLARAGTDKSKILQATIWLADISDFSAMNEIYDAWVDKENPPARACGEAKLATPDHLFEIIVIAAV